MVKTAAYEWWQVEINQMLLTDDTALVADCEEKLCRLVIEFGKLSDRRS